MNSVSLITIALRNLIPDNGDGNENVDPENRL